MANKNLIGKTLKKGDFVGKVTHITDSQITMINEYGYEKTFDIKKKVVKDNKSVKDVDIKLIPYLLLELDNNEELVEDTTITDMPQQRQGLIEKGLYGRVNGIEIHPQVEYYSYIRPNDNQEIKINQTQFAKAQKEFNELKRKDIEEGLYTKEIAKSITLDPHFMYRNHLYAAENHGRFICIDPREEYIDEKGEKKIKNADNPSFDKYALFAFKAEIDPNRDDLQSGNLHNYIKETNKLVNELGLYSNYNDVRDAVNRYFELNSDYEAFKQEYSSNIEDYFNAKSQNKSKRGINSQTTQSITQETTIRKNTNAVSKTVGFNSDGIFVIGVKNPNLSIGDKSDYLHIGRVNNNIYTVVYHEYGDDANFQEVCTQFKPDRETINKLNSCQNILQAYSIIKEYWDAKALEYNLDISELYCRIDGPSIIQLLKDLGYQESDSSMFNPNVYPHYVPKSFTFRLGEGPQRELINYFS